MHNTVPKTQRTETHTSHFLGSLNMPTEHVPDYALTLRGNCQRPFCEAVGPASHPRGSRDPRQLVDTAQDGDSISHTRPGLQCCTGL